MQNGAHRRHCAVFCSTDDAMWQFGFHPFAARLLCQFSGLVVAFICSSVQQSSWQISSVLLMHRYPFSLYCSLPDSLRILYFVGLAALPSCDAGMQSTCVPRCGVVHHQRVVCLAPRCGASPAFSSGPFYLQFLLVYNTAVRVSHRCGVAGRSIFTKTL